MSYRTLSSLRREPRGVERGADLFVELLGLSQQPVASRVVAEHGGQLGAPLKERSD